ncbi:MAG: demethoxyubiquinone hydroxylase family protein [Rhodospirillales bacterium]|jgi:ubiquinone biosynthesis monooxygenase Coq7|uniref:3-demethoxyubiquinol 3-hydroxylase n=2 Tax=root TaxID=1 RepID=A0A564WBR3_9PROT|nr:demethoxyubiquinone hydroxylase family protein [Rhodospirillales bacterium]SUS08342.1 2-nonaprenyl-3-methyl-6-methoxy-1,4-benzoquinol hydroxylase [uncultured Defluviicoccus sp.]VUX45912.1 2-nonaprenyl-3-methyl-6-methoxy-1,4-benzoquinol hydroxylase [Candidatus Defluviicoccus seviourii]
MTEQERRDTGMPSDLSEAELAQRFLRVNHAGEYGAVRIYAGQLAVLGRTPVASVIRAMAAKEDEHLRAFDRLLVERRVRPTVLHPLWHVAGFALGAATALMGARAAMACTAAVEEVIDDHYRGQVAKLTDAEADLRATFESFRQDEVEHRDTAIEYGARKAPAHGPLTRLIKGGSRLAIWLSERI